MQICVELLSGALSCRVGLPLEGVKRHVNISAGNRTLRGTCLAAQSLTIEFVSGVRVYSP